MLVLKVASCSFIMSINSDISPVLFFTLCVSQYPLTSGFPQRCNWFLDTQLSCLVGTWTEVSVGALVLYLREGAGSLPDHPDDTQRDANHGGHGHEPADTVAPVRVGVHVVVLQRFVFNQEKQENPLFCKQKQGRVCKRNLRRQSFRYLNNKTNVYSCATFVHSSLLKPFNVNFFTRASFPDAAALAIWDCSGLTAQMPGVRIIQHHLMKKTGL